MSTTYRAEALRYLKTRPKDVKMTYTDYQVVVWNNFCDVLAPKDQNLIDKSAHHKLRKHQNWSTI